MTQPLLSSPNRGVQPNTVTPSIGLGPHEQVTSASTSCSVRKVKPSGGSALRTSAQTGHVGGVPGQRCQCPQFVQAYAGRSGSSPR